jgi:hypothetical protein
MSWKRELKPVFEKAGSSLRNVAQTPEGANVLIHDILTEELTVCVMAPCAISFPLSIQITDL